MFPCNIYTENFNNSDALIPLATDQSGTPEIGIYNLGNIYT